MENEILTEVTELKDPEMDLDLEGNENYSDELTEMDLGEEPKGHNGKDVLIGTVIGAVATLATIAVVKKVKPKVKELFGKTKSKMKKTQKDDKKPAKAKAKAKSKAKKKDASNEKD